MIGIIVCWEASFLTFRGREGRMLASMKVANAYTFTESVYVCMYEHLMFSCVCLCECKYNFETLAITLLVFFV